MPDPRDLIVDTPESILEICIPRSYWDKSVAKDAWKPYPVLLVPITDKQPPVGYHSIPESTRAMYNYGCGHTLPIAPETKRLIF